MPWNEKYECMPVEQIPEFQNFTKKKQTEILLKGTTHLNNDGNVIIMKAVQSYLEQTERFDH